MMVSKKIRLPRSMSSCLHYQVMDLKKECEANGPRITYVVGGIIKI